MGVRNEDVDVDAFRIAAVPIVRTERNEQSFC